MPLHTFTVLSTALAALSTFSPSAILESGQMTQVDVGDSIVSGRVVTRDGVSEPGAEVSAYVIDPSAPKGQAFIGTGSTNEDGRFEISRKNLPEETLSIVEEAASAGTRLNIEVRSSSDVGMAFFTYVSDPKFLTLNGGSSISDHAAS